VGILANGYIGATGVFQIQGATVINNAYPSARLANFARTGAARNITAGEGITSGLVSKPSGNRHPSAWMMPQKPGALAARNSLTGEGSVSGADAWSVKLAQAALTGSGSLEAVGGLIVQLLADIAGDGGISESDLKAFLQALADIGGSGGISDAQASGLGELIAALAGLGTVEATLTGTGELTADLLVTGTGLTTSNVGQAVWAALAAANNGAGTMGEKLNDAGSGSNPWAEIIESGFTAAQILRILAAHAAGAATGLEGANPQFIGLDGATVRIDGTYSAGNRTINAVDGD
jgi:hypothetical protein